ncbi:hypothetical protein JF66_13640 [Cryobacterium sp. MLB-32]|uniref:anti-sigma factor domain-containing protein n=1 Tax=Cryobacterium sp. MLB-32 TaxID=1529318 RepID=UPI0004E70FFC|nr:anti-sigma factor [Cryobacterium sp. MLB-32]KFF59096.1 hypothetical protein JF66_13640 [Cryobacterium sp. MLB-32]
MTHLDPDALALMALAEISATPAESEHLAVCTDCADELLALQHTVDVGRAAPTVELLTPDPAAWARIHAALGLSAAVAAVPSVPRPAEAEPVTAPVADSAVPDAVSSGVDDQPAAAAHSAPVVSISRARRLWIPLAAAAVLGLVAGYAASSWLPVSGGEPSVLARAELAPLPGWNANGQASVEALATGERDVLITLDGVDAVDGVSPEAPLREVWLLSPDATKLVSLGLLNGTTGRFVIPAEIDLAEYPLVDVSAEPNDGNPAHSADSVVRGELRSS